MSSMPDEDERLKRRFIELAQKSSDQSRYSYTGFLSVWEQELLSQAMRSYPQFAFTACGGYPHAERQMARFGSPQGLPGDEPFPISCIKISPLNRQFADPLTHRDFLGAALALGVRRAVLGDIVLWENTGHLFCTQAMGPYICEHLSQVKHTGVRCSVVNDLPEGAGPRIAEGEIVAASLRLDALVAAVFSLSRSESARLFREARVSKNGRPVPGGSADAREGDLISVRGLGRFIYQATKRETKSGRLRVLIERFQ